eukprot:scaffold74342_cov24-Prasinocladus_malaysianus.AAC.2
MASALRYLWADQIVDAQLEVFWTTTFRLSISWASPALGTLRALISKQRMRQHGKSENLWLSHEGTIVVKINTNSPSRPYIDVTMHICECIIPLDTVLLLRWCAG